MHLLLLGTDGCHLCEDAKMLLNKNEIIVKYVDIALHEEWQNQFALLIPVLFHVESQRFLIGILTPLLYFLLLTL